MADPAKQITQTLSYDIYSDNGLLVGKRTAFLRECVLWIRYSNFRPCQDPVAVLGREEVIDLRVLQTQVEKVKVIDRRNKGIKRMGAQLRYTYQPNYGETLGRSAAAAFKILEEEYQRYPNDVLLRLRVLQGRYDTELNIDHFHRSYERTRYCSHVEIQSPMSSGAYDFFVNYEIAQQFIDAIDKYAQTCSAAGTS